MKLSKRLQAIYYYIPKGSIVADIGCDHAQLCCALVDHDICVKAYACDVNEKPLLQAKANIDKAKNKDRITTLLSNGLEKISDDVDVIVIAGMGFETIKMILEAHLDKCEKKRIIVQSNTDVEELRRWISLHQFNIIEECVILDDHYYQIIVFNTEHDCSLTEHEIRFGKKMKKDFIFYSFCKYRLSKLEVILSNLKETHPRFKEVLQEMRYIYEEFGS